METFAITGSGGQVGKRVVQRLADVRGIDVRPLTRADASYRDGPAMRTALNGATTLLLVSGRESAERRLEHATVIDAAGAAGVKRIVYLSFAGAAEDATFTFARDHWYAEQHIRRTGLRFTFLRDNLYLSYLPMFFGAEGVLRAPAGDGRIAAVAHDDIAAVVAEVLTNDGYGGQTLTLTGPEALTLDEVAAELTRVSGREFRYERETLDEAYASRAHYGAPQFEVEGWVSFFVVFVFGVLVFVLLVVERITGRPFS